LQAKNSNPWPSHFLQAANLPFRPTLTPRDYEKIIELSEGNCGFFTQIKNKMEIPWSTCFLTPESSEKKALADWVRSQVLQIEEDLAREGLTVCDFSQKIQLAKRLFESLVRPIDQGGMGMQFDFQGEAPERDITAILRDRKAACSEFVFLFLFVADLSGIPA